ncbi:GAF domain-containing protein [Acidovorax sp. LjRoot66]|uniref:GAF domain-containing protein n=1 Tax=Acidovorax sp. LjRoot66 TaxID=3342334 RepID=UPI003ECEC620
MPSSPSSSATFADFVLTAKNRSVRDALARLLLMTDFRYIGIWRFQGGMANAAVHFDRQDPSAMSAVEVSQNATYCCYVRESGKPFKTPHALVDERLNSHPARSAVASYVGVPVMDSNGTIVGTLCHYDLVPRDVAQVDTKLMLLVASYLTLNDLVPPYPTAK